MATIYCDTAGSLTANCGLTRDLWTNPLQARLAGITPAQINCELSAAIREFYFQSRSWREQIGPYHIYANNDLVWLNPVDAYSNVMWVHDAWIEHPTEGRVVLKKQTMRETGQDPARPRCFSLADPSVLRLSPMPDESLGAVLWINASLVPVPDATRLPNVAQSHHYEAILEGALARLHLMPNKPWTDQMLASRYAQTFRRRCVEFRAIADQGYVQTDPPWRFPPFA